MIDGLRIVKMNLSHIEKIAELEKCCFSQPWSVQSLQEEVENPLACFVVALLDDEVAGYAGMHCVVGECYIDNVAVFPKFRKKGVASALMQYLIENAKQNQCEFISLEVRKSNQTAIHLYERFGFETVGVRKNFYIHPTEDGFILTLYFKK